MPYCPRDARRLSLVLLALLASAGALADPPRGKSSPPPPNADGSASGVVTGVLAERSGIPVLEIWGTAEQAGYAHGYLLAEQIMTLVDGYIFSERVLPNPVIYERMLKPSIHRQFVWTAEQLEEARGLLAGMQARIGTDGLRSKRLERVLDVDDLLALNATADWFGMFCSSVTVWGARTADGHPLTARNLDFPFTESMLKGQIVVIRRHDEPKQSWISVTWPGCIGVYTALNEAGVTMLMHDANNLPANHADGFTPRSLILRDALEHAAGADFLQDVLTRFKQHKTSMGNNIHVSGPRSADHPCAGVFEIDANEKGDRVTLRTADDEPLLQDVLWCTNHMRKRTEPSECRRYEIIAKRLTEKRRLDPAALFEIMHDARQHTTLHTVVLDPQRRVMHAKISAITDEVVTFDLKKMLAQPPGRAAQGAARAAQP